MNEQNEIFIKMVLDMWNTRTRQVDKLLTELSDEQLMKEIVPGKNRGVYLLGHLIVVNDKLFELLNLGKPIFPHLHKIFFDSPDKTVSEIPLVEELKQNWINVNMQLSKQFNLMHPNEWFQRHTSVSQEDFKKEPHRNKLNIMISRSNHLGYHLGQMALLKKNA